MQPTAGGGVQQPVDAEAYLSPAAREEYTRGVDKIITFPIDGARLLSTRAAELA